MEQFFCLLIALVASSSIISEGNHTNTSAAPSNTSTLSEWPTDSSTIQTSLEQTVTPNPTSHRDNVMTSQTSKPLSTAVMAHLSSSLTGSTVGSSRSSCTSGHSVTTGSTSTTSKSYTDTSQNAVSSSVANITGFPKFTKTSTPTVHSNTLGGMTGWTAAPTQTPGNNLTMLAFGVMSLILILIVVMVILVTTINLRGRCRGTKQQEGIKSYNSVVPDSNMTNNCEKESITLLSVRTINTDNETDSPQLSSVRCTIVDNEDQELNRDLLGIKGGL
ncbi:endothelial cell-specific chemotaxis regulator-like isoform X2 [Myxocyprinus asiaticus]|uniref:endothelial cell-specific chemotaxis regulator-like isoform X2 n=1 Tax=Myxocyprinus asiaticus TaxID=70543 RepID=UPI0022222283|nr:endothelial cell-specific chemotaxis regulator-like isoform X2 [Myxocyprinus asiaticus]